MIRYKCEKCKAQMIAPETLVGRTDVCPKCKTMNIIPKSSSMLLFEWSSRTKLFARLAVIMPCLCVVVILVYMLVARRPDDTATQLRLAEARAEQLKAEIDELREEAASYEASRKDLRDTVAKLVKENDRLTAKRNDLEAALGRARAERIASVDEPDEPGEPVPSPPISAPAEPTEPAPIAPSPPVAPPPPEPVAAAPAPDPAPGMPKSEQEKIRRMVSWLQGNVTCISCGGKGTISGNACGDCAEQVEYMARVRKSVPSGRRVYSSAFRTWVPEYVTVDVDEIRHKGNGKTPIQKLRPTLSLVLGLCIKHRDTITADLLTLAKGVCMQIDPDMRTQFP